MADAATQTDPQYDPSYDLAAAQTTAQNAAAPVLAPPPDSAQQPMVPTQSQPDMQIDPRVDVPQHMGWLHTALDKVANILGPSEVAHARQDPKTGDWTITKEPSTTSEKWGRIAAAALSGAAQGAANSRGPGGIANAGAAGVEAGMKLPQQQQQEQQQQVDFNNKQMLAKANRIHLTHQTYLATQQAKLNDLKLDEATADLLNKNGEMLASSRNAVDYGSVDSTDPNGAMNLAKKNPGAMDDFLGKGNRVMRYAIEADHKMHMIGVDQDWEKRRNEEPMDSFYEGKDENGAPVLKSKTVPANGDLVENINNHNAAVQAKHYTNLKNYSDAQNKDKDKPTNPTLATLAVTATTDPDPAKREAARKSIDLMKEKTGTGTSGAAGGAGEGFNPQNSNQQHAQMMVDGLESPSQLSKRAKDYNQIVPMAQAYSMQKYGEPFDAEISEGRYQARKDVLKEFAGGKPADQIQSFQAFTNHAQNLMDDVASFRTGNVKVLNTAMNALKKQSDPTIGPLIAHISALRREYQNFLSNNMALKGDEIREGKEIMDENSTPAQIESAAKAFMTTAIGRVSALDQRARRFNVPVGEILTPHNRKTINNMGLEDYATQMIPPAQQQQHMFNAGGGGGNTPPQQQQQQPPQVPSGKFAVRANGRVIGYADDAKGTNYNAF